ncbi:MAG: hypothetical protein PHG00_04475 [Methylococcales bacterium]|nr:hypothetical protein [Methylococcales bacterium]
MPFPHSAIALIISYTTLPANTVMCSIIMLNCYLLCRCGYFLT